MTLEINLTVKGDVQKLHVGPQDIVLFTLKDTVSKEDLDLVRRMIQTKFSQLEWVERILVIAGKIVEVKVLEGGEEWNPLS